MPRAIHDAVRGFNSAAPAQANTSAGVKLGISVVETAPASEVVDASLLAAAGKTAEFSIRGTRLVSWRHKPSGTVTALVTQLQVSLEDTPGANDWTIIADNQIATQSMVHAQQVCGIWARIVVSTLTQSGQGAETVSVRAVVQS